MVLLHPFKNRFIKRFYCIHSKTGLKDRGIFLGCSFFVFKEENEIKTINWYIIKNEYVNYLKQFDNKVQNIDYKKSIKPYIGMIFSLDKFNYYVPISSPKSKHYSMGENIDFLKIMDGDKIISVINLNNMIPVDNSSVELLDYKRISRYIIFKNQTEKLKYIALLRKELLIINNRKKEIFERAKKLYEIKINSPKSKIAKRCCNFKLLERKSKSFNKK